jgi:cytochrome c-type biogenesis protein CcsB
LGTTALAHLSDTLYTFSIVAYAVAMVSLGGEYAFGRRGRVARTSAAAQAPAKVLVGAGAPVEGAASVERAETPPSDTPPPTDSAARDSLNAERFGRIGVALLILGVLVHAAAVSIRGAAVDRVPWGNMYEFTSVACLVAVVAFLTVLIRQPRLRYLGGFVLFPVIVLMFLGGTVLYAKAEPLVPALHSYWLAIHVSSAAIGTGIFMVSSVGTLLYLVRIRADRLASIGAQPGRLGSVGSMLPSAASLDRMAYRTVAFGFPIYTFGIMCGAIWAEAAWGKYWSWDPKETWALITWITYAAYLHARATAGWKGRKAAYINLVGFAAMIFNFFVVNIVVSGLHSYAGLN